MATNSNEKREQAPPPGYNATISGASGSNIITNNTQQYNMQGQMGNGPMVSTASSLANENSNAVFVGIGQGGMSKIDYQTIKAASDTLKRNPKIEFSRSDLLKLLSYLEGELQAREVVVAALKSEKVKQYLQATRYKPLTLDNPHAALFRDTLACSGNIASRQSSSMAAQSEQEIRLLADHHLETLESVIMQQRHTQVRMINVLHDAEDKHKKLVQELEDEKRKHERDTAQGDDIAYGLELERTKLKQELESEKTNRKKIEKDTKKLQEVLDNERARQKQIVLLLLAERKKIIMKYVEERKRSEDLAQILSEEKLRVDTIAEGLEEESKKSLRMEAELEKQLHAFEIERKALKNQISKEDKRAKDFEMELSQLRAENETLRKQPIASRLSQPQLPNKPNMIRADGIDDGSTSASPMMSSVAKVVQPTATVTSVPVSGPTTGIARCISPGQSLRQSSLNEVNSFSTVKVPVRKLSNSSTNPPPGPSGATTIPQGAGANTNLNNTQNTLKNVIPSQQQTPPQPPIKKMLVPPLGRGVPPPIPPNKPVVPPKRETSVSRLALGNNTSNKDKETHSTINSGITSGAQVQSTETLEEEIQDFQQVLCSMTK